MALDDQPGNDETQPGVLVSSGSGQPSTRSRRGGRGNFEIAPGDVLGDYEIERRLGAGGMGEVFAANDRRSGERVALKVLAQAGSTALVRFKREFRALADVTHPNLVSLRELVVPADGVPFFTMELIDGVPFNAYVRGRTPVGHLPNLVRLGRALGQLVVGIHHLHLAQCLHRDVKPSNVLVARAGRVAILDFGLVSELADLDKLDEGLTHDGAPLGTPAYMAPEQAVSGKTTPASDFYAIGVMLYECLTGSLPFQGSAIEVMLHKQDGEIPDPRLEVADVPAPLRTLCMRLLARDPESRPSGPELLAELERLELGPNAASSSSGGSGTAGAVGPGGSGSFAALSLAAGSFSSDARLGIRAPFIGRRRELSLLSTALRDVEETETAVTVHVHGSSGFGKSALLTRFLARARRKHDVMVLAARCLERESVPYKGVDAIIDALSVQLRRMPAVERAALQPRGLGALTRIFPVLGDVWEAPAPNVHGEGEAAELRRLGLAGLRELIQRLSARKPIVISIDDFQWADVDSVRLLNSLMRPPNPPAVLVMLGFREDLELRPSSREALAELTDPSALGGRDVRELLLGSLDHRDALDLAMKLMGDAADPALARIHVERAGGNPFHLAQITLGAAVDGASELTVDELLARRIVELAPELRRLLAIVAAAGGPVELAVLLELLERGPPASIEREVDSLCVLGLLVRPHHEARGESSTESRSDAALDRRPRLVETANLRIREVVLGELETDDLRVLHLQLADVLAHHDADLEAIAEHLVRGGEAGRAADLTERAAEQAGNALAFARAVELYQRTLDLLPATASGVRRRALRLALAHQLANLGRGAAAADMLLELAVVAQPAEARSLRRRAAEQLLRSGRIDEGIDLSRTSFTELGEPMPRGFWSTVWMIVRERLRLWLRGGVARVRLRPESEVPEQLLTRLDLISNVATGLSLQELILTQALHSRALVLACEAGEPRRLGVLLCYEFVAQAALGRKERARAMLIQCRELATHQGAGAPELDRAIDLSEAMLDWFGPRMGQARSRLAKLLRRLEEASGADWVRAYAAIRYAETCVYGGFYGELRRELPRWLAAARERGNLHELASLHGLTATICLSFDELDEARRNLDAGRECWDSSRYTVPDLTLDLSAANVKLYAGDFAGAHVEIERVSSNLRSSGMGRIPLLAEMLEQMRVRHRVREAVRKPDDLALRREVERACKRQRKFADPLYRGEARINDAALHSLLGEREATRRCWREAVSHFEEHAMATQLAAVRLRLAAVTSGRESAEYEALGEAYLREHGIPNRARFVDWIAPAHVDRRRAN
jgi:serine/threonine protein kinase